MPSNTNLIVSTSCNFAGIYFITSPDGDVIDSATLSGLLHHICIINSFCKFDAKSSIFLVSPVALNVPVVWVSVFPSLPVEVTTTRPLLLDTSSIYLSTIAVPSCPPILLPRGIYITTGWLSLKPSPRIYFIANKISTFSYPITFSLVTPKSLKYDLDACLNLTIQRSQSGAAPINLGSTPRPAISPAIIVPWPISSLLLTILYGSPPSIPILIASSICSG